METALDNNNNNNSIVADKWFQDRIWAYSANKLIIKEEDGNVTTSTTDDESNVPTPPTPPPPTTLSSSIYLPTSTEDVAEILRSTTTTSTSTSTTTTTTTPSLQPVACVCGGHEGSNASLFACKDAIILDFSKMKDITISGRLVTVQAGVVTKELVSLLKERQFALPIGTGPDVGIIGYIVNGGLSGYFSRRLGLLGQRVTKFTFVTADGDIIKDVTKQSNRELFLSVLGAGSSLGVVTEITLELADASIIQTATQIVVGFESDKEGQQFAREALEFLQTTVLPNPNASMEIVYSAGNAIVITFVFYDSYQDDPNEWIKQIKSIANNDDIMPSLSIVAETTWHTWHETATALWPVIGDIKGNPRSMLQHSVGTKSIPSNTVLDFLVDTWIGKAPIVESSIVECRTLGGAILEKEPIPTGNANHTFFADTIVIFDAANKSSSEIQDISNQFEDVLDEANAVDGLDVDISGTHSQGDSTRAVVDPSVIFGSNEFSKMIASTKLRMDPKNRFRFHPYWNFLPSK